MKKIVQKCINIECIKIEIIKVEFEAQGRVKVQFVEEDIQKKEKDF